jgi:N-acetylglutamate synthase-like GNAT family acetyltransferase
MSEIQLLNIPLIEWLGYLASTVVLISLSLSSIVRLRLFNLVGSLLFSVYGFYIGALPVGIMNLLIVFFNLYYLQKLYFQKDDFELIEVGNDRAIVQKFVDYYRKDIQKYFPGFELHEQNMERVLLVMRNMNVAGVFVAHENKDVLEIDLDYVAPPYRDYKNGIFLFNHFKAQVQKQKYTKLLATSGVLQQQKYLEKVGFTRNQSLGNAVEYHLEL